LKLKKINENGYTIKVSQVEINALNELLAYVNAGNSEYTLAQKTYTELEEFFNQYSTFELEDIFHPIMNVQGRTFLLDEYPVELHLKKDLLDI
jgi:ABC-type molybdate transport system substrate-binding protein